MRNLLLTAALLFSTSLSIHAQSVTPSQGGGGSGSCSGDINSGCSQVTGTHLASALPVLQGGTGLTAGSAGKVLGGATPSYVTVTSSYVDNSIALTGTDINTSNQVTATHLASALPVLQGGTGLTAGSASKVLGGATPSYVTITSSYVDNSIALTGTDINTSNQVTATHLAAGLPIAQGGVVATSAAVGQIPNTSSSSVAAWTFTPTLGASGTLGSLAMGNATSGTVTLAPVTGALGSVTASLPANTGTIAEVNFAQTWSALQTFGTNISIGGVTATGATGTGKVVFDTGSTIAGQSFGTAAGSAVVGQTVASGATALGTSAITSGTCATVVTVSASGVATTDAIIYTPSADPTGVTGYAVSATGSLYIWAYPTSGNVNFKVCNNTSGSLTPSALTLNWRVAR